MLYTKKEFTCMDYNQGGGNQNNNQWDRWNSNASNSSYYNQPIHRPHGQGFTMASVTCGILSITTCCTGILPLPLGALGILFAVLVYRKGRQINSACVMGITTSCIGIAIGLMITIYSFAMLPTLLKNEAFRSQFDTLTQQMYGMDFEEFLKEYYGYTIGE